MAGHSKWAQIKRKKAVTDQARSKVFSKYSRLITVESKRAKGDVYDPGLRAVIDRAKNENMPKDSIERAVKKGLDNNTLNLHSIVYETYGPGGVAILIDTLTDNRNRTTAEIKHLLTAYGCELAAQGSAQWAFTRSPEGVVATSTVTIQNDADDERFGALLEALENHDDVQEVHTNAIE